MLRPTSPDPTSLPPALPPTRSPSGPRFSRGAVTVSLLTVGLALVGCVDEPAPPPAPVRTPAGSMVDPLPGGWIVQLDDATAPADVAALAEEVAARTGGRVRHVYDGAVRGFALEDVAIAVADLDDPRLRSVRPDIYVPVPSMPSMPSAAGAAWAQQDAARQFHLDRADQRRTPTTCTYRYDRTGAGVDVYVIDSGVRATHVDLGGRATIVYDATRPAGTAVTAPGYGVDEDGHGTAVASIIGGTTFGVAKAARLQVVKVYRVSNATDPALRAQLSDFIEGTDWVYSRVQAQRAAGNSRTVVANFSIGAPRTEADAGLFTVALNRLTNVGVQAVVADQEATGNQCDEAQAYAGNTLAVGAVGFNDQRANGGGLCSDVYAPTAMAAAWKGSDTDTHFFGGTSGAAPVVAGVAALHLEQFPRAIVQSPLFCAGTPVNDNNLTCTLLRTATTGVVLDTVTGQPVTDSPNRLIYSRLLVDPAVTTTVTSLPLAANAGSSTATTFAVGATGGTAAEYRLETSNTCWLSVSPAPNTGAGCVLPYDTTTTSIVTVQARTNQPGCVLGPGPYSGTVRVIGTNGTARTVAVNLTVR
jgi:subtilisin family serine protease